MCLPKNWYDTGEVDAKIDTLLTGIEHGASVFSITNDPATTPVEDETYIVGLAPTGDFNGHPNELAVFTGGVWRFTAPQANETHLVEDQSALFHWNGTKWVKIASTVAATGATKTSGVGEIIPWMAATIPDDYLPCNGQTIAIAAYADLFAVIGNKYNAGTSADGTSTFSLPDLRGYFLRGINGDGGETTIGSKQQDTTRMPRTPFGTDSQGDHVHGLHLFSWDSGLGHSNTDTTAVPDAGGADAAAVVANRHTETNRMNAAGAHTHTVTGGDPQTQPKSIAVQWVIRVHPINGGAKGDKGDKGDTPPKGDLWTIGSIQQSWLDETQFRAALGLNSAEDHKWVLCDGRNVAGSEFTKITGLTTVPDLRGSYLRMAGQNSNAMASWNGGLIRGFQSFTTAAPGIAFTGVTNTAGVHSHVVQGTHWDSTISGTKTTPSSTGSGVSGAITTEASWKYPQTGDQGSHTHTVTINGGGDAETRPSTMAANFYMKIN